MTYDLYPAEWPDGTATTASPRVEPTPTPQRSALAVHRDPSLVEWPGPDAPRGSRRHVRWVRPTDLAHLLGSRAAARGIDLPAELALRARRLPDQVVAVTRRGVRSRALRLAPLSAFGGAGDRSMAPGRSAVRA